MFNCDICPKTFVSSKSLSNHKRWHDLPQYKQFQVTAKNNMKLNCSKGQQHYRWAEGGTTYTAIHRYVRKIKPFNGKCEECGNTKNIDLANINGTYNKDPNNYKYLCRSCHMKSDDRMLNLKNQVKVV